MGSNVSITNDERFRHLVIAIINRDLYGISMYINHASSLIYIKDHNKFNICHYLLKYGFCDIFIQLFKNDEIRYIDFMTKNCNGDNPIQVGIQYGLLTEDNLLDISKLINIDFEEGNNFSNTILHNISVKCNKFENIIKSIYDNNMADMNIPNYYGYYPIMYIAINNNNNLLNHFLDNYVENKICYLYSNYCGNNVLHYLCKNNNLEIIKKMKTKNIDIYRLANCGNKYGKTPIIVALDYSMDIIKYFITEKIIDYSKINSNVFNKLMKISLNINKPVEIKLNYDLLTLS